LQAIKIEMHTVGFQGFQTTVEVLQKMLFYLKRESNHEHKIMATDVHSLQLYSANRMFRVYIFMD
jgi:hypothetical protein